MASGLSRKTAVSLSYPQGVGIADDLRAVQRPVPLPVPAVEPVDCREPRPESAQVPRPLAPRSGSLPYPWRAPLPSSRPRR